MLKRIEVKNFKSLKHVDFKCAGLNLLMGLNGAGKSSFVQLMMYLRYIVDDDNWVKKEKIISDCVDDLHYCYSTRNEPIEVEVDYESIFAAEGNCVHRIKRLYVSGQGRHNLIIVNPELFAEEQKLWHWQDRVDSMFEGRVSRNISHGANPELDTKKRAAFREKHEAESERISCEYEKLERGIKDREGAAYIAYTVQMRRLKFVSSFRERPHAVYDGGSHAELIHSEGMPIQPNGSDLCEFLSKHERYCVSSPMLFPGSSHTKLIRNENLGSFKIVQGNDMIRQLQLWLNEVSSGARIFTEKVEFPDDEKYVMSVGFEDDKERKHRFKPQNVGFGISYVLPVLIALLTSSAHDIVIIENPEAHLHPKGQSAMGNLIARAVASGIQVFVETHSDHVVNGIRSAVKEGIVKPSDVNIAFFERKEHDVPNEDGSSHQEIYSEVRNIRVDKNGSLSEYPDGFMDEWNNQLMELL